MNVFRRFGTVGFLALIVVCTLSVGVLGQDRPLAITSGLAYNSNLGAPFQAQLTANGGSAPYSWKLGQIALPEGLSLGEKTGLISGTPTASGEFRVPVVVTDSSSPMQEAKIELIITITAALEVTWKQPPAVREGSIQGTLQVINHTPRTLNLTVIVVAVNEIDKAFALGYQHFAFKPNSISPVIPFGSQMPFGSYVVRADAVGEDVRSKNILRSHVQTGNRLTLRQQ